ncbi:MAG: FecR family protein [Nitrospiria bacterium]
MRTFHRTCYGLMAALILNLAWTAAVWAGDPGARILSIRGLVEVQSASAGRWTAAAPAVTMQPGDALRTGAQSSAVLQIDGARMTLHETTLLRIPAAANTVSTASALPFRHPWLEAGRALFDVTPQKPAQGFSVRTPTLVAGVKGTVFEVVAEGDEQAVYVWEGLVEVSSRLDSADTMLVAAGMYTALERLQLTPATKIPFDRERPTYRERGPSSLAPAEPANPTQGWLDADASAIDLVTDDLAEMDTIILGGDLRVPAVHTSLTTTATTTTLIDPLLSSSTSTATTLTDPLLSPLSAPLADPLGMLGL